MRWSANGFVETTTDLDALKVATAFAYCAVMGRLLRVIWRSDPYRCELHQSFGLLELRFYEEEQLRKWSTCRDPEDAEKISQRWLAEHRGV
jgi:hypothetical protein